MTAHPENQLKRVEVRRPRRGLVGVLVIVAAAAIAAAAFARLAIAPAVVIAGSQAGAAGVIAVSRKLGRHVALAAALLAVVWGVAMIVVHGATWPAVTLAAIGAFETMLVAGSTPR